MFHNDRVKIIDFGLSVAKETEGKLKGFFGTPLFAAPEVFDN
jgi:serine/threonine protein kinase